MGGGDRAAFGGFFWLTVGTPFATRFMRDFYMADKSVEAFGTAFDADGGDGARRGGEGARRADREDDHEGGGVAVGDALADGRSYCY